MEAAENRRLTRFHEFELDLAACELRRNGRPVRLERRPLDLLILLVERAGELVPRDEIVARLWGPDVFVDVDAGVNTAVRKVRQALRDASDTPRFIQTVPGRGYRFIAPVEVAPAAVAPAPGPGSPAPVSPTGSEATSGLPLIATGSAAGRRTLGRGTATRALVPAVALLVVVASALWMVRSPSRDGVVTLAILPLQHLGPEESRACLADGLTEELVSTIGQTDPERVAVIGLSSTARFRGARESIKRIGAELGADYVVEGSLQAEGERIRVMARLVRAADEVQVWADRFDREGPSLLALQQELSQAIARRIEARVLPARQQALATRQTVSQPAYDLYLRGLHYWSQLTPATNAQAVDAFTQAIAIDPSYTLAWAGLGATLVGSTINGDVPPAAVAARARDALERASTAQPAPPELLFARGLLGFFVDWTWDDAERALGQAIEVDPSHALAVRQLAHLRSQRGAHDEAAQLMARARLLDPLGSMTYAISAQLTYQARDHEAALAFGERALALDPQFWIGHVQVAQAAIELGRLDRAADALVQAGRLSGNNSKALSLRGYQLARQGDVAGARQVLAALEEAARTRYVPPHALALVHAGLGDTTAALDRLDQAYEARDVHLVFLTVDPKWDALRAEPRFVALLERCGFGR